MRGSGSLRLMANPRTADKCITHMPQCKLYRSCPKAGSSAGFLVSNGDRIRSLRLVSRGLLAFGTEFLALLALEPLGVGFLRAFERGCGARFLGFLFRRCHFRARRGCWRRRSQPVGLGVVRVTAPTGR